MGGCPAPCPHPCMCPGRLAWQDGRHVLTEYLLSSRPGVGGLAGTASQTGLALQGLLAAMLVFSSPCIRRSGHFEVSPTVAPGDAENPRGAKAALSLGRRVWGEGSSGWVPVWVVPRGEGELMSWHGAPRYLTWTPPTPQICGFGGSVLCFII